MIEKVNPKHPDKVADRIAGAIVDLAYTKEKNPKIAVEVLIGHGRCHLIIETNVSFTIASLTNIVKRIAGGNIESDWEIVRQDKHLAKRKNKMWR